MNLEHVQPVVEAVLYEGYILYPYRPSSAKNRQRWTFGGVYPNAYDQATGGADPCRMQTQCLVEGDGDTRVEVRVRFLHPLAREVGRLAQPADAWPDDGEPAFALVDSMVIDDKPVQSWQEASEREVAVADCTLDALLQQPVEKTFAFAGGRELEPLADSDGIIRGVLLRSQRRVQGRVEVAAETVAEGVYRLTVRIENHTRIDMAGIANRDQASLYAFASTHTVLGVAHGAFVSLMDPPAYLGEAAAACDNQGAYPVLVGAPGTRDTLLASPIILYDYPQVAPESKGDLYDATEIDELLSLSILAMTDAEKREMAAADPRAAALLARTEKLDRDDFVRMHGALRQPRGLDTGLGQDNANPLEPESGRGPKLAYSSAGPRALKVGDSVRLQPKAGGDAMDMILAGKTATIQAIERDFEDSVHVAVTIDDDPGRHWGAERMPGHRFFFAVEEVEPLRAAATGAKA